MKKQSTRLEFEKSNLKLIYKAAAIDNRSAKNFMELAVMSATLQTLNKKS